MKLTVRMIDTPGGPRPLLCDEAGNPLPQQLEVEIKDGILGDFASIKVTIRIDGDEVKFA
jgi:hypothetical protein